MLATIRDRPYYYARLRAPHLGAHTIYAATGCRVSPLWLGTVWAVSSVSWMACGDPRCVHASQRGPLSLHFKGLGSLVCYRYFIVLMWPSCGLEVMQFCELTPCRSPCRVPSLSDCCQSVKSRVSAASSWWNFPQSIRTVASLSSPGSSCRFLVEPEASLAGYCQSVKLPMFVPAREQYWVHGPVAYVCSRPRAVLGP